MLKDLGAGAALASAADTAAATTAITAGAATNPTAATALAAALSINPLSPPANDAALLAAYNAVNKTSHTTFAQLRDEVLAPAKAAAAAADHGGIGVGAKIGVGDFSGALGITYDKLGVDDTFGAKSTLALSAGVAYAIPDAGANVSLTGGATDLLNLDSSATDKSATGWQVVASADYAVLPGVTLATDLGYGDSNSGDDRAGAIQWLLRVKAAF